MNAQPTQSHRPSVRRPFIRAVRASDAVTSRVHGAVSQFKQGAAVPGRPVQGQQQRRPVRRLEACQALRLDLERKSAARRCRSRGCRLRHQNQARRSESLQLVRSELVSHRSMRRQTRSGSHQDCAEQLAENQFERTTGGSMLNHGWFNREKTHSKSCPLNHGWFSQRLFAPSIEPWVVTFLDIPRAQPVLWDCPPGSIMGVRRPRS